MRRLSRTALFPRITAALVASALAGTSFVPLAVAQDKPAAKAPDKKTKEAARKAYGAGEKAFNAGDYAGAYEQFTKAHDLIPTPHAEYWMAAALDKQGKDAEALAAYKLFLKNPGAGKVGEDRFM